MVGSLKGPVRLLCFLLVWFVREAAGQTVNPEPESRADQIEAEQAERAAALASGQPAAIPNSPGRIERLIHHVPVHFAVEGLGPGAGPAAGLIFTRSSSADRIIAKVWGVGLLHGFYRAGTGIEFRNRSPQGLGFTLEGSHADAPQLEYYGPGPGSSIHNRTDFRREDTLFNGRVTLRRGLHFSDTCHAGELLLNVGPGTNSDLAQTQVVFGPAQAPGIDVQSNFVIAGCAVQFDFRDAAEDPHKGSYAEARYDRYFAQDDSRFSFHSLISNGALYIPFFNNKRVITLREKTAFSFHSASEVVPFYLQPTLASDTDLRGFRRYRFYDENAIALTGEYRWEICTGLDMALFVDGGKVFHSPGDLALSDMESSAGFGFRFINQRKVVARLDAGFSREGVQIWLRAGKLF